MIFEAALFFTDGKNDHEFLVVGGIWGVVTGGTGPRPCLAPDGGNTVGGGGDGEGTPTTSPAPVIKKKISYRVSRMYLDGGCGI